MRSLHQPSLLQSCGSMGKEKWKDLKSKKQDDGSKEKVSSTHNRNNKHLISQKLLQYTQDFTGSKQAKISAAIRGNGNKVLHVTKDMCSWYIVAKAKTCFLSFPIKYHRAVCISQSNYRRQNGQGCSPWGFLWAFCFILLLLFGLIVVLVLVFPNGFCLFWFSFCFAFRVRR